MACGKNVKNLNQYDTIDYKVPVSFRSNDYRTATDRAHPFYPLHEVPKPIPVYSKNRVLEENPIHAVSISETTQQFPFKQAFSYQPRAADLPYRQQRLEFAKNFGDKLRWKVVQPINEYQTSSSLDYQGKCYAEETIPLEIPSLSIVQRPIHELSPNIEGYAKYLDPYISTTHLDHTLFTKDKQLGIAKKNAITFWDWMDYPKTRLGFGLKESLIKQKSTVEPIYDKCKFNGAVYDRQPKKTMKFVPNNGMTTEMTDNYKIPVQNVFQFGEAMVTPPLIPLTGYKTEKSEYEMYGSGKRVHKVLKQKY